MNKESPAKAGLFIALPITLERFASLSHLAVIITGQGKSTVDEALAQHGLTRRIALRTPHFLVAPMIVAESDLILTLPRKLAQRMAKLANIEILELPIAIQPFELSMIWHERQHYDPAHIWLRNQVLEVGRE